MYVQSLWPTAKGVFFLWVTCIIAFLSSDINIIDASPPAVYLLCEKSKRKKTDARHSVEKESMRVTKFYSVYKVNFIKNSLQYA